MIYQYGALERLISAATVSSAWGLSWSYDGFGNRLNQNVTKGTAPSMSTLVDANTNRLSGFGYSYDSNGNLLTMPQQSASMAYDASNRMVTFTNQNDTESYQYAPDNKRVWRSNACQDGQGAKHPSFYYYSVFGQLLGEYCTISGSVTVKQENFHFGGRIVAKGDPSGAITSLTTDRLHSKGDGSTFFPYGETKSGNPITGDSFATYSRDWTGLDYADQRWYAPGEGRFTTVDPMETSAKLFLPTHTMNWYSYAAQDPVRFIDPQGTSFCDPPQEVGTSYCLFFDSDSRGRGGDAEDSTRNGGLNAYGYAADDDEEECDSLKEQILHTLNANKRTEGGSFHGLIARIYEQLHGHHGPGTAGWKGHQTAISDTQRRLRKLLNLWNTQNCGELPLPDLWKWATREIRDDEWVGPNNPFQMHQIAAIVLTTTGVTYLVYRFIRLGPSLVPVLWWTLPMNLVTP